MPEASQKILVLLTFLILGVIVGRQAHAVKTMEINQQKERAMLNAKVYAEELRTDFERGKNITDALDDTVVATNGKVNNFERIASHEMEGFISSIQLAPQARVQYIYPQQENEAGMLDLLADKERAAIVEYSIRNRVTSMQGPFQLKQGGYGIAIRNPVFTELPDGGTSFWGFAIAIIKVPDIFEGTLDALKEFGYDYCLDTTVSPLSSESVRVASSNGGQDVPLKDPVQTEFRAAGCVWTLNVARKGGWKSKSFHLILASGFLYQIFATVVVYLLLHQRQQHRELVRKAVTDELTGLLSRRGLMEALAKHTARNQGKAMTIAFIDLDDFKQINDLYGHNTGDEALKNLAMNLQESFPKPSIIGRSGGDEFCAVILDRSREECEELIREAVKKDQSFTYENQHYSYTISVGYADYPGQADDLKSLLNCADEALYMAKIAGKHQCVHYLPSMSNVKRTQLGFSFKDVMNGIPGAFMIYSAGSKEEILFANNELIRMTGCSDFQDFLAWSKNSFRGFVHPDDLERVESSIQSQVENQALKDSHREDYVEYRITRKDGSILPVVDIGRLIYTEHHGDVFFVFIRKQDEFNKQFRENL